MVTIFVFSLPFETSCSKTAFVRTCFNVICDALDASLIEGCFAHLNRISPMLFHG